MRHAVLLAVLALCMVAGCQAGGYRNGHKRPERDPATLSFNYVPVEPVAHHRVEKSFNWCDKDGLDLCTASWNQHIPVYCGACWAHGTLAAIQDRIKIKKRGLGMDVMLSRQTMLNCGAFDGFGAGCDGGDPIDVFHYMSKYGLPDESCQLYSATDHSKYGKDVKECPDIGKCMNCMPVNGTDTCWPVKTPILYKLKSYGKLKDGGVAGMMAEIRKNGPITCSVATPENFVYDFRGGIALDKDFNKSEVDHDVEVVGWGEEDGVPFWHVRNSWGTFWGELGFFRLERGRNALQIEAGDCWVAEPDFEMEDEVREGDYEGSMYGLVENDRTRTRKAARLADAASCAGARTVAGLVRKMRLFVTSE